MYNITAERAENGRLCIEKLTSEPEGTFDLILMDVQMPEMDGKSATKKIRKLENDYMRNIPIIAMTADADENCLNMARQIADGEQVVILTQEEASALREAGAYAYPPGDAAQGVSAQDPGLVNINTATVTELTTVSGIGASRAQAIVDYRERNGSFGSIDDIKKVDGIKDGLFSKIKDKITI